MIRESSMLNEVEIIPNEGQHDIKSVLYSIIDQIDQNRRKDSTLDSEALADNSVKNLNHDAYRSQSKEMKESDAESEKSDKMIIDGVKEEKKYEKEETLSQEENQNVKVVESTKYVDKMKSTKRLSSTKVPEITPRATRSSQNPDFAAKHRKFLSSKLKPDQLVDSDTETSQHSVAKSFVGKAVSSNEIKIEKRKRDTVSEKDNESEDLSPSVENESSTKKRKSTKNEQPAVIEGDHDCYCWRCHRDGTVISCETCVRVYHPRCIQIETAPSRGWVCPECSTVMHAENIDTRSKAMQMLTLDHLCKLLQFAVNRMKSYEGAEDFIKPVDTQEFQQYRKFIIKPMDLSLLEENIKNNLYGSTEAFLADAKWILHNCVIFNTVHSKFTNTARALLKICRQEMLEIENCPDCYQNAHTRSSESWFIEVCRRPHLLVWAKLKFFPYWPAKAMSTNNDNMVDVRFFGAHDRAWVPLNSCYLYSKMPPVLISKKKNNLDKSIQELEAHIKKLKDKFGTFEHAPYKTAYLPKKEDDQLKILLPNFDPKLIGSKRVGRLIHDRVRSNNSASPEKKKHTPGPPEKKEEDTEIQIIEPTQKRKAKPVSSASRPSKAKCLPPVNKEDADKSIVINTVSEDLDDSSSIDDLNSSSPPKFFISKLGLQKNMKTGTTNETKMAFVDKLQEKLTRLEESNDQGKDTEIKHNEINEQVPNNSVEENESKEEDKQVTDIAIIESVVVLHDLKNNKAIIQKLTNKTITLESLDDGKTQSENNEKVNNTNEVEISEKTSSEVDDVIEIDSSPSSVEIINLDDGGDVGESEKQSAANKKKNNIDSVVETIKVRKSSTDVKASDTNLSATNDNCSKTADPNNDDNVEISESTQSSHVVKARPDPDVSDENEVSSTRPDPEKVCLDNSEYPLVIIDEPAEDNMSSSSSVREVPLATNPILKSFLETSDKPDKSRRKGKPAKVCNRESIDSEFSNTSRRDSEEVLTDGPREDGVLDEVSGRLTVHKSLLDAHIDSVLEEVSKLTQSKNSVEETNVTINVLSDESTLSKKSPKDIRASVNLSKDVSLSVLGDNTPLDMECISDTEDTIVNQQIRPTARKTLPKPISKRVPVSRNSHPPQRKSVDSTEGLKVRSPQSLKVMSPPLLMPVGEINKSNIVAPIKFQQNGHVTPIQSPQMMPMKTPPAPRILPPLHKPNQNVGPAPVGSLNAHLDRLSQKLTGRLRIMFEDLLKEMSSEGCQEATVKGLQLEMERMQWRHRQEVAELKHNTDLVLMEVRASMEADKQRMLMEAKHKFEQDKEMAIQETKCKQWCAYCRKEALLYCCWNTAYCSYPCQQNHWLQHMPVCAQNSMTSGSNNPKPIVRNNQMHDDKSDCEYEDSNTYSELDQDFDTNNNEDSINDATVKTKPPRRKRCGECEGCSQLENCQNCRSCLNQRSHQVCQKRRCSNIMYNRSAVRKRLSGPNVNNMKPGTGGFIPLTAPSVNNTNRNVAARPYGPGPQFMPLHPMHHQPQPGGFHHPMPEMQPYQHHVFMS